MQYTEVQTQDLLLLRRLFYGRQAQLDKQRRSLVSKLSANEATTDSPPVNNYSELTGLARELRANAAEEHCLRLQCCCACFRGVSSLLHRLSSGAAMPRVALICRLLLDRMPSGNEHNCGLEF